MVRFYDNSKISLSFLIMTGRANQMNKEKKSTLDVLVEKMIVMTRTGLLDVAEKLTRELIAANPQHSRLILCLGVIEFKKNNYQVAKDYFVRSLAFNSDDKDSLNFLTLSFMRLGDYVSALEVCDKAIRNHLNYPDFFMNRGLILQGMGNFEGSLKAHDKAISLDSNFVEAHSARGIALHSLAKLDDALNSHNRAIELDDAFPDAYSNRANVLKDLGRFTDALENYDRAIEISPDPIFFSNRGNTYKLLKNFNNALRDFDTAIKLDVNNYLAYWNKALLLLLLGDYKIGWRLYDYRWKTVQLNFFENFISTLPKPMWKDGLGDSDSILYVYSEQGFGDIIHFCRYISLAAKLFKGVIFQVPESLLEIVSTLKGANVQVISGSEPPKFFDFHCALMSLPGLLKTRPENIPNQVPYLFANPDKCKCWRGKLGDKKRFRVGLVWASGFRPKQLETIITMKLKSIPLNSFSVFNEINADFLSLQKGELAEAELKELRDSNWTGPYIIDHTRDIKNFSDTAALIESLDLVITVCTSVAHLAGALGKKTWVMIPYDSCWRWFLDRKDSPWYPSITLYRQTKVYFWDDVLEEIRRDLKQLTSSNS